ncbi:MAG: hypothetical protein ABJB86_20715 [Bacteroidota bacterium]
MKAPILLKTYAHSIFSSELTMVKDTLKIGNQYDIDTASLAVEIDFEKGTFSIEGDWHLMINCNKHVQPEWLDYHTQRVNIAASIFPSCTIDLSDQDNDGAVFVLEGSIKDDENNLSTCSGLLILDKETVSNNLAADAWKISFYLYDNSNEDCEITLKIPVIAGWSDIGLN